MADVTWLGLGEFGRALNKLVSGATISSRVSTMQPAGGWLPQARTNASGPARSNVAGRKPVIVFEGGVKRRRTRFSTSAGTITLGMGEGGPGVVTGRLRNSIMVVDEHSGGLTGYEVTVAPTVKYARRLELGFTGPDSLGRHYDQPPYPYFGPAYDFVVRYAIPSIYAEAWAKALAR